MTVDALVAECRFLDKCTVDTVFAVLNEQIVEAVFVAFAGNIKVTIFVVPAVVAVVTVFAVDDIHAQARHLALQFGKLFKKRSIKIKVAAVVHRIPVVAVPLTWRVDFKLRIRWIHRDNWRAALGRFRPIKSPVIPPRQPALIAALGAKCWICYSELVVEGAVFRCDLEVCCALSANFHEYEC